MARSNIFRIPKGRKYYTNSERLDYKIVQTTKSIEHLKKVIRAEEHTAPYAVKNKSYQTLKRLNTSLQELRKLKNPVLSSKNRKRPKELIVNSSRKLTSLSGPENINKKKKKTKTLFVNPGFIENRKSGSIITTTSRLKESFAKEKFEKSVKNYPKGGKTRRDPFATQKDPTDDFNVNDLYRYK